MRDFRSPTFDEANMTELSRDIILDLLPLYLAGEVSAVTRAAVDEYLGKDPSLADYVRKAGEDASREAGSRVALPPEVEIRSLERTRKVLALQRWMFALAIAFTSVGLSTGIQFNNGRIAGVRLVALDHPLVLVPCLLAAVVFWIGYLRLRGGTALKHR